METNLFVVPTTHIHQFWHLAERHLQRAIDTGNGEFTIDQLRQFVAQGNSTLLLVMDNEKNSHGAVTVQWINYPNDYVAYVTYLGGKNILKIFNQFELWAKNNGATKIQCSTGHENLIRLYQRYKFKPKYTLMEYKL